MFVRAREIRSVFCVGVALAASVVAGPSAGVPPDRLHGLRVAAFESEAAAGVPGATYSTFRNVAIGDDGRVAFQADLDGVTERRAIFLADGRTHRLVALPGQLAPDGETFQDLYTPSMAPAGPVFIGITTGELIIDGNNVRKGGFFLDRDGVLDNVVAHGDPAPRTGGGALNHLQRAYWSAHGDLAFSAETVGAAAGLVQGIFRLSGGTMEAVVVAQDPAPDSGGAVYHTLEAMDFSDSGEIAFAADLAYGVAEQGIFLVEADGTQKALAFQADPAPGTGGGTLDNVYRADIVLAGRGRVVFRTYVDGGTMGEGLFLATEDGIQPLALIGDPVPGTGGGTFSDIRRLLGSNQSDLVVFRALVQGGTVSGGIFGVVGGRIIPIAFPGDPIPGTNGGVIGGFENLVDVNAAGDVVFVGIISYGVAGSTRGVLVAERFFPLPVPASGPIGLAVLCLVLAAAGCSRVGRR